MNALTRLAQTAPNDIIKYGIYLTQDSNKTEKPTNSQIDSTLDDYLNLMGRVFSYPGMVVIGDSRNQALVIIPLPTTLEEDESVELQTNLLEKEKKNDIVIDTSDGYVRWLSRAEELEEQGLTDDALDLVYSRMDSLFQNNKFDQANHLISDLNLENYSRDILLTFMNVCYSAHTRLRHWPDFVSGVKTSLENRELLEEGLEEWFERF